MNLWWCLSHEKSHWVILLGFVQIVQKYNQSGCKLYFTDYEMVFLVQIVLKYNQSWSQSVKLLVQIVPKYNQSWSQSEKLLVQIVLKYNQSWSQSEKLLVQIVPKYNQSGWTINWVQHGKPIRVIGAARSQEALDRRHIRDNMQNTNIQYSHMKNTTKI